jgi:hypothetical protein
MTDVIKAGDKQPENRFEQLFEAANRDPDLKKKLLANPHEVAEQWNVKFSEHDVEQLTKLNAVVELANDVQYGRLYPKPGPIGYPIDIWRIRAVSDIFGLVIKNIPKGYPPYRSFETNAAADVSAAFGLKIIPGPIFYPIELLARAEAVLGAQLLGTVKSKL